MRWCQGYHYLQLHVEGWYEHQRDESLAWSGFKKIYKQEHHKNTDITKLNKGWSIFAGWLKNGKLSLSAARDIPGWSWLYPQSPAGSEFGRMPNMVRYD